jgi:HEAT repeat protein
VISLFAIAVFAVFQSALLVGTATLLVFAHRRAQRFARAQRAGLDVLREPLRMLMMREDAGQALAAALATLDSDVATSQLLSIAGSRLGPEELRALAPLIRPAQWVENVLACGSSRTWWRRMDAARMLAVVGTPRDRSLVARLLVDPHPAVASAATDLIVAQTDPPLIESVILGLPACPSTVRQQHMRALRSHADEATAFLVPLLGEPTSDEVLRIRVQLAETLGTPAALAAVIVHAWHPVPSVRATVARALRSCFLPAGMETAHVMLHDDDWEVRAAAARALGGLQAVAALTDLEAAMSDESWWVRFRSALALRGLGARGEAALQDATRSDDPYARDMAIVALGLTEASRLELSA